MYLKELTLKGFKSFASATTLRFEPGITAVVGPNGSGKSNIVDALTWVMGEQGARNLRGTSMEDVIFAGTSSRPPLGRAQVSLTIDNTDRTLDIDYTEVTISRTIFRNGGSQYAINGSACRLLDIQELLSDTGLGSQMHVIVGQGQLDRILHADPAGHRAFIEEAAGILKHRRRKERALRKLAATEKNLTRLDDLLGEIHRQLGPLGRQARVSRRADGIRVILRDAQARLHADDAMRLNERRQEVRGELTDVRAKLSSCQRELAEMRVRVEQAEAQARQTSPAIARLDSIWHEMGQLRERMIALAALAEERSRSLLGQIVTNTGEDPDLLRRRADELTVQSASQQETVAETRMRLDAATERRAEDERRLASLRQTITELRKTARNHESQMARLRELIAREETLALACETRRDDASAQREALGTQLAEAKTALAALNDEVAKTDDGDEALDEARRHLETARSIAGEREERSRSLENRIVSLQAKADALADTLESRNASDELSRSAETGSLGRVAEFIEVREGWEEAVSRALGDYAGALVVPGESDLLRALELTHERHMGKAVLIRLLDAVSGGVPIESPMPAGTIRAADLVSVSTKADDRQLAETVVRAVSLLLQDVAVASTAEEAQRLVAEGACRRAVTQSGELFDAGVAASGGSALSQSDLSLVARRNKALKEIENLRTQLDEANRRLNEGRLARDAAAERVQHEQARRTERRLQAKQAEKTLKAAVERVNGIARQIEGIDRRISAVDEERESHRTKLDDLRQTLRTAEQAEDAQADFDELAAREHDLETALASTRDEETEAKLQWTEAARLGQSLKRQASLLNDNAAQAEQRRRRVEELNGRRRAQSQRAGDVAREARRAADDLSTRIDSVESARSKARRDASAADERLARLRSRRNELEPNLNRLQSREHELDLERERLAASHGQLQQKISDDLGMTYDEIIAGYGPDKPVPVLDDNGRPVEPERGEGSAEDEESLDGEPRYRTVPYDREEQLARLDKAKRDLSRLGRINPLAAEEFEALEARNRYFNEQRADVAKSREDLLALIKRLDATMIDVFNKAFADTAAAFETMFGVLFPGGQGSLVLENPDDLLSTGVLVRARPAGKRVRQLSLLSGGERSLTALAFLFAIFTARPSPFYVMDEVEAALDDVNLTRLLGAFERLREHAQLIVITHQQRTMGIADALYGVTMRSDGVTAVVSQRLSDHGR
ncbi:chromosome segregation protein SMC [Bifidobacterium margollesii]|uniref:Chromosome partition protein Smc n=1 Tax=Bifidobacterium margollesii TaxID=2020964 RepID=A0A2N5J8L2_9BIFI|nr:chromosome segregation protein SMC [Bifidobacterium margollesii]PLS30537.1 chromosome segregation protein SMC [Bifidobacterium margollesii]